MSDNKNGAAQPAEPQTTIQLAPPSKGELVAGWTVQGTGVDIAEVYRAKHVREMKAQVQEAVAEMKRLADLRNEIAARRDKMCAAVEVPADLFNDLETVATPYRKFCPDARVQRTDGRNESLKVGLSNFSFATSTFTAHARILGGNGDAEICVERQYPIPAAIVAEHDAYTQACLDHAAVQEDLQEYRDQLAGADEMARDMKAALIEHCLSQTESGQQALNAIDKSYTERRNALEKRKAERRKRK